MSKETKIEWADSTLNFWSGCTKVSDGCKNCYAEALSNRKLGNIGGWGKGAARKRHQSAFNLASQLNKKPLVCSSCGFETGEGWVAKVGSTHCDTALHRRRVFSLSLGDWLDPEVPIEWLAEMLDTIRRCDQVQWLLVTKRPELWRARLEGVRSFALENMDVDLHSFVHKWLDRRDVAPPKHVMVLTSVENQKAADERIPALLKIPAAQHGLSCEPLLGPVNLDRLPWDKGMDRMWPKKSGERIDWVIIGGESGPNARECNVEWIQSLVGQCQAAVVASFVKQLGASCVTDNANMQDWPDDVDIEVNNMAGFAAGRVGLIDPKGGDIAEWPEQLRVRQFPEAL